MAFAEFVEKMRDILAFVPDGESDDGAPCDAAALSRTRTLSHSGENDESGACTDPA